jgi:hypothetical protein
MEGDVWAVLATIICYTVTTAAGSAYMMRVLKKSDLEKGRRKIGG